MLFYCVNNLPMSLSRPTSMVADSTLPPHSVDCLHCSDFNSNPNIITSNLSTQIPSFHPHTYSKHQHHHHHRRHHVLRIRPRTRGKERLPNSLRPPHRPLLSPPLRLALNLQQMVQRATHPRHSLPRLFLRFPVRKSLHPRGRKPIQPRAVVDGQ